jgi:regulator of sigma E protease
LAEPVKPEVPSPTKSWLSENYVSVLFCLALLALVLRYLHPMDVILAAAGLTFIIFLHELGHFAAAKLCNVRVEAFSIGFGPALPFCSYKYGETTYKLAMVPLGGFVKMLGEGDGENDEGADTDPRSFKNQTVPERMFIISAGVIMNILLGIVLFLVVYLHGLEEKPAVVSYLEPGGAAWRQGLHSGTEIKKLGTWDNIWFDDIRPVVWGTSKGELLDITMEYKGTRRDGKIEPVKDEGAPFPVLGITSPDSLTVFHLRRMTDPPYRVGSPAAKATGENGATGFLPGDKIIAMTDPDKKGELTPLTPLTPGPNDPPGEYFVFQRRLERLAGETIQVQVKRKDQPDAAAVTLTVPPAFRWDSGMRMRMGPIVAIRQGSAAAGQLQPKEGANPGDRIVEVEFTHADGTTTVLAAGGKAESKPNRIVKALDPLQLPIELNRWSDRTPGEKVVKVTVLREKSEDHTQKRETMALAWNTEQRFDLNATGRENTPLAINGLGLAYQVQAVADDVEFGTPAALAGIQPNDTIEAVKFRSVDHKGKADETRWSELKPHQWAYVDGLVQLSAPHAFDVRVNRGGQKIELAITTYENHKYPINELGLMMLPEFRIQQANSLGEALGMGAHRTIRKIRETYINLTAMVMGRVSAVQTISGPITLGRIAYLLAGQSTWQLLLMMAMISINLAVVNFLPIPVLDGGHMMFLIYEGIVGKPPPERVYVILTYFGLFLVLCMMAFTIGIDIYRLLQMWLRW